MNRNPLNQSDKDLVADLQRGLDELRKRLGIRERGEVLFRSDLSYGDDEIVIAEADGLGGGILRIIEGNYPVDYLVHEERAFPTEAQAQKEAASLSSAGV